MPHFIRNNAALLGAFTLFAAPCAVNAQVVFFPNNATINAFVGQSAVVGYVNAADYNNGVNSKNGTNPTVNIIKGGYISRGLFTYNRSIVNLNGGHINGLFTLDSSTVNINSGILDGGSSGNQSLYAGNNSTVNFISGKSPRGEMFAVDSSVINVSGSVLDGGIYAYNNNTINVTGGSVLGVEVGGNSVANISGGALFGLVGRNNGAVNLFGVGLNASLITAEYPRYDTLFSEYALTGVLTDGTNLDSTVLLIQNGVGAKVTFNGLTVITSVPEPGSVALFFSMAGVGFGVLRRRRK